LAKNKIRYANHSKIPARGRLYSSSVDKMENSIQNIIGGEKNPMEEASFCSLLIIDYIC